MSYCRWSSDNFECDVYVYEHVDGGWTTHVAGNRHVGDCPKVDLVSLMAGYQDADEAEKHRRAVLMAEQQKAQHEFLSACERRPIGLSRDGETFSSPTPGACADLLEDLMAEGYNVPQYAIEELRAEQKHLLETAN